MQFDIASMSVSAKINIWNGLNTGLDKLSKEEAQVVSSVLEERSRTNNPYFIPAELNPCRW